MSSFLSSTQREGGHELLPMGARSSSSPDSAGDEEAFDLELEQAHIGDDPAESPLAAEQDRDAELNYPSDELSKPCWQVPWVQRVCVVLILGLVVLILIAALQQPILTPAAAPGPAPSVTIQSSAHDARSYRFLQLASNSLPVLLIHDVNASMAAGSLSVGTGSGSDPFAREGLAHFLEHMLFLGSSQFPDEHAYASYLSARGGYDNAYTSESETNYFFRVQSSPGNLAGILPMFAGFFTAPLLTPSSTQREMVAVAAEHAKNILNDEWRGYRMLQTMADVNSDFNHFGTGTVATLNHSSIVSDLHAFHSAFYLASNQKLVLLGAETLDELESFVRANFNAVPGPPLQIPEQGYDGGYIRPATARPLDSPFDASAVLPFLPFTAGDPSVNGSLGWNVSWVPASSPSHSLSLYFPFPSNKAPLASAFTPAALGYLSYMLGHEGSAHTLCSVLKSRSLAQSVSVETAMDSKSVNQTILAISIVLTEAGNSYEARSAVMDAVFDFIALLQATPLTGPTSHELHYKTMLSEDALRFEYAQKQDSADYVKALSSRMSYYLDFGLPISQILWAPASVHAFDASAVQMALCFLSRENVAVVWSSSDLANPALRDSIAPANQWQTDPFYSIIFLRTPLDASFRSKPAGAPVGNGMELPPLTNDFLPSDFTVMDVPGLVAAAAAEVAPATAAQQLLQATVGTFNASENLPVSLPLPASAAGDAPNTLLYKPDIAGFSLPYAFFSVFLRWTPDFMSDATPLNAATGDDEAGWTVGAQRQVQFQLCLVLLDDVLSPLRYQLSLLGYSLSIQPHPAHIGVGVTLSGFSSNLAAILQQLLPYLLFDDAALASLSPERFATLRTILLQSVYESYRFQQPYKHGLDATALWEERSRPTIAVLQALLARNDSSVNSLQAIQSFWREEALQTLGVTSFVYGNLNITAAAELHDAFMGALAARTPAMGAQLTALQVSESVQLNAQEVFQLPAGNLSFRSDQSVMDPAELNSALVFSLQICQTGDGLSSAASLRDNMQLALLGQMLAEATFNILRTQWSLGYMVWGSLRSTPGAWGASSARDFTIIVQNALVSPRVLEAKAEWFLARFASEILGAMSEDDLGTQKDALRFTLSHARNSALSMDANWAGEWAEIFTRARDVTQSGARLAAQLAVLDQITLADLQAFYSQRFLDPLSRRKLVVSVFGAQWSLPTPLPTSADAPSWAVDRVAWDVDLGNVTDRAQTRLDDGWSAWPATV